jgi:WD40 repeat protein
MRSLVLIWSAAALGSSAAQPTSIKSPAKTPPQVAIARVIKPAGLAPDVASETLTDLMIKFGSGGIRYRAAAPNDALAAISDRVVKEGMALGKLTETDLAAVRAQYLLLPTLAKIDGDWVMTGTLVDLKTGTSRTVTVRRKAEARRALEDTVEDLWRAVDSPPQPVSLTGHSEGVLSVAWSPNGKQLATGSWDKTARVWDSIARKQAVILGHGGPVLSVAFSPDGKLLATGSGDDAARVWDLATGREQRKFDLGSPVYSVAFTSDGKRLAAGTDKGTVKIWDSASGQELVQLGVNGVVWSVAFSPDGRLLATGAEKSAQIWAVATGRKRWTLGHDDTVLSVAWHPDGKSLATGAKDGFARVWEPTWGREEDGTVRWKLRHEGWVKAVAFSPDGKYLASGSVDTTARVWDTATGQHRWSLGQPGWGWAYSVSFSSDAKLLAIGWRDETARVWDLSPSQ